VLLLQIAKAMHPIRKRTDVRYLLYFSHFKQAQYQQCCAFHVQRQGKLLES